jgi:hypothetical protein
MVIAVRRGRIADRFWPYFRACSVTQSPTGRRDPYVTTQLLRLQTDDDQVGLFEIDPPTPEGGFGDVAFGGAAYVHKATEKLEQSLAQVNALAQRALATFREGTRRPDKVELEFGVKFTAETGTAIFAKAAGEAHLVVKLSWSAEPDGE